MSRLTELVDTMPELTEVAVDEAGRKRIQQLADYILQDGGSVDAIVKNLERLKFETIVTGKTTSEILAEREQQ